jgi:hypothetical protein
LTALGAEAALAVFTFCDLDRFDLVDGFDECSELVTKLDRGIFQKNEGRFCMHSKFREGVPAGVDVKKIRYQITQRQW